MSRRPWATVIVAMLTLLAVVGCVDRGRSLDDVEGESAGAPGALPFQVVQGSYDRLLDAGTARIRSESTTQIATQDFTVPGEGVADFGQRRYDLSLELPVLGQAQVIGVDDLVYARNERASAELAGNPEWLLVDPNRLAREGVISGAIDNPVVRFAQSTGDALPQLALLKGARDDVRVVGPAEIAGTPVTEYEATLDLAQARRFATDPRTIADLERYTSSVRDQTLPAEVWVDDEGRLRQMRLVFSTVFGQDATTAQLTFTDLGLPLPPITAPPPDRVTPVDSVLPPGMGGG